MKTLLTSLTLGASVTGTAFAQATQPVAASPTAVPLVDALTLKETFSLFAKDGSNSSVAALDSTIGVKAIGLDWHITVPAYVSDSSGYGGLDVGTSWTALNAVDFIGSKTSLAIQGGLWMPIGSANYETTNLDPHLGLLVGFDWGKFNLAQSADWRFVGGSYYDPYLDRVSDDVATLVTNFDYTLSETVSVGVDLTQKYVCSVGDGVVLLGPSVEWKAASNVTVGAGIGFPVWQQLAVENNCVANAAVSFKF